MSICCYFCCVYYSDTVSRCGVFCALVITIDQCMTEGVVDVFQAVKALRLHRPGSVHTLVQYQSLFQLMTAPSTLMQISNESRVLSENPILYCMYTCNIRSDMLFSFVTFDHVVFSSICEQPNMLCTCAGYSSFTVLLPPPKRISSWGQRS